MKVYRVYLTSGVSELIMADDVNEENGLVRFLKKYEDDKRTKYKTVALFNLNNIFGYYVFENMK